MTAVIDGSLGITFPDATQQAVAGVPAAGNTTIAGNKTFSGIILPQQGIQFPATQNPSSDANTLDDYEEGSWTPTFTGSVSNPTIPMTVTGKYVKVGRIVWVGLNMVSAVTGTGSVGSGNLFISGLPFTSDNSLQETGASIGNLAYWTTYPSGAGIMINDTRIELFKANNTNSQCSDLNNSNNANYIRMSAVYLASA